MLREGAIVQDRQAHLRQRYPAKGLHWLLGLVRLAQGDLLEARREFDREVEVGPWQLYAAEFAMNAHDGAGFAALAQGEPGAAVASFGRALELYPEHARSLVGLGAAHAAAGDRQAADAAYLHATRAIEALRAGGRTGEATISEAFLHAVCGRPADAVIALERLVGHPELPFTGWTVAIEPLFAPLRQSRGFAAVLSTIAAHAR